MLLTLVITTFNRREVLRQLLQSLEAQTDSEFEVVVVMDHCTDGTREMLERLETGFALKWLDTHCTGYGLAVARNLGILAAEGEAVVILDDDSFPQPGFVEAHKRSVRQGVITGGPRTPSDPSDRRQVWKMRELAKLPFCDPVSFSQLRLNWPTAVITECNICMYRRDLIDMGLFSEQLKIYGFIGQEFFGRAEYLGYKYQYNPDANMLHHRQPEGKNGLNHGRKLRQARLAAALRPTLMTPRYYDAQIHWAHCMEKAPSGQCDFPGFWLRAAMVFPYRYARGVARRIRQHFIGRYKV